MQMARTEEAMESPKLFERDGLPPIQDLLPTSPQHVPACLVGAIGGVGVMFGAAERMAAYEDKHADGGNVDCSAKS